MNIKFESSFYEVLMRLFFIVCAFVILDTTTTVHAHMSNEIPPNPYSNLSSISLKIQYIDRESFDYYLVASDGSFLSQQFDKDLFNEQSVEDKDRTWKDTPINFVYFDGIKTTYSSYASDPTRTFVRTISEKASPIGNAIHAKSCPWPILNSLIEQGTWSTETNTGNIYTLFIENLDLTIKFDPFGRIRRVVYSPKNSALVSTWSYEGYDSQGHILYPSTMTRSYVMISNGNSSLNNVTHHKLFFVENPPNTKTKIHFVNRLKLSRYDQKTDNVFDSKGSLLYNASDARNAYYEAVGYKNPTKIRNALFFLIGILALCSIFIWRGRSS